MCVMQLTIMTLITCCVQPRTAPQPEVRRMASRHHQWQVHCPHPARLHLELAPRPSLPVSGFAWPALWHAPATVRDRIIQLHPKLGSWVGWQLQDMQLLT